MTRYVLGMVSAAALGVAAAAGAAPLPEVAAAGRRAGRPRTASRQDPHRGCEPQRRAGPGGARQHHRGRVARMQAVGAFIGPEYPQGRSWRAGGAAGHHRCPHASGGERSGSGQVQPGRQAARAAGDQAAGRGLPEGAAAASALQWFEVIMVNPSGLTLSLADLDSMLPDRPMLLSGSDGHTVWANSAALKLAHITAAHPGSGRGPYRARRRGPAHGHAAGQCRRAREAAQSRAASLDHEAAQLDKAFDVHARHRHHFGAGCRRRRAHHADIQASVRCSPAEHAGARLVSWLKNLHEPAEVADRRGDASFARNGRSIRTFCAPTP